jgi:hypothetical protein
MKYPMARHPILIGLMLAGAAAAGVIFTRIAVTDAGVRPRKKNGRGFATNLEDPMTPMNAQPTEEEIAALAQRYWEDESRPEGKSLEHWHRAETELRQRWLERLAAESASPLPPAVAGIS